MSHTPILGSSPGLPNDVIVIIVSMLDQDTLRRIRFCCKWLAKEAARYLFAIVTFQMRAESMEKVIGIANSSLTAYAVKTLELTETPRLCRFSTEEWYRRMACRTWYLGRRSRSTSLLSSMLVIEIQREADPDEERSEYEERKRIDELFQEYEAERKEPTLYKCIHTPGPSIFGSVLTESPLNTRTVQLRRLQKACNDLEKALVKLRNLKEVQAYYIDMIGVSTNFRWRNYDFLEIPYEDFYRLEMKQAALQQAAPLAFLLRALGKRNSSINNLTSLVLDFSGVGWWGLQDLSAAWQPKRKGKAKEQKAILMDNLATMGKAFHHLTNIEITFTRKDDMPAFLTALALFLNQAKKLRCLELELHDSPLRDSEMLTEINKYCSWPMLTVLCLQGFNFRKSSILQTLSLVAPTLQEFSLGDSMLLDSENTWSHLFEDMRLIPFQTLHHLDFRACDQNARYQEVLNTPPQRWTCEELDARSIVIVHMKDENQDRVMGYSSLIYDYILRKTDVMPPLKLFSTEPSYCHEGEERHALFW